MRRSEASMANCMSRSKRHHIHAPGPYCTWRTSDRFRKLASCILHDSKIENRPNSVLYCTVLYCTGLSCPVAAKLYSIRMARGTFRSANSRFSPKKVLRACVTDSRRSRESQSDQSRAEQSRAPRLDGLAWRQLGRGRGEAGKRNNREPGLALGIGASASVVDGDPSRPISYVYTLRDGSGVDQIRGRRSHTPHFGPEKCGVRVLVAGDVAPHVMDRTGAQPGS